jgi:hypothetical protein
MTVDIEKLKHALPLSDYGKGIAKSFEQLRTEIETGETQIIWQDDRPIRLLSLVFLKVCYQDKTLVEERQEFPDGRVRHRSLKGLSEKLYPQEDPDAAVYRALQEELGLLPDELKDISIRFLDRELEEKESPSYPGLMSQYDRYEYEVPLPDHLYKPKYIELSDRGMRTYFVWRQEAYPDQQPLDGQIVLKPVAERSERSWTLEHLLAGVTPANLHTETDTGDAVGHEAW